MEKIEEVLKRKLAALSISEEDTKELIDALRPIIRRKQERMDFMHTRMLKDKNIAVNLLNQAIDDLQVQQEKIQEANRTLVRQKELLEEQSRKLQESLERLEMSYEELEQFSYIASHDLRSPLRTIASYAQLLQRRYSDRVPEEGNEFLDYIISGALQMNNIISDLLAYSFIKDGRDQFSTINMQDIIDMVRFHLHTEIEESAAVVQVGSLPETLTASRSGMLQLFQNLVGNAIKFRSDQPPHITISGKQEGPVWQFRVSDNGIGLDETYSKKIFLPFQRLSDRSMPGSGIGLAICKKIVKLHGGSIWYNSRPGDGATFFFTIPISGNGHQPEAHSKP